MPPRPQPGGRFGADTASLSNQLGGLSVTQNGFQKMWGQESLDLLQNRHILPSEEVTPPKPRLQAEQWNNANCSSEIFRSTLTKIPETEALLKKARLPLGVLIHPFKDLSHLPVIQCTTIVRCRSCRTYINPFVHFVDQRRWRCNLCYRVNELPEEFLYDPVSKSYGDPSRRPECKSSTIEFIAPQEYMLRPPQPAVYLFLLDVSRQALETGYLRNFCDTLAEELDKLPGDARTQIGFITYHRTLQFYQIVEGSSQPTQLIVGDIDDVFLPSPSDLLPNLNSCKEQIPQQGPGFFGSDPVFPSRVTIKNGVLGLSSHHAIHGNWNDDITIENVHAKNFQTHGIQLNGFTGLTVRDVEIGPSVDMAYLNGNYAHMRLILPTLKKVAEDADTQDVNTMTFRGRDFPVTMWNLMDKLVEEMDMAYAFAMYGTTFEDHPFWDEAVAMFINPSGLPMGAVLYGLFLNYPSAGIFGWHVNDQLSYDATVENVYIHDLRHKGIEVVGFQSSGRVFCNAFNGPLPANDVFGENVWNVQHTLMYTDDDPVEAHYVGSIVSDIHIAQYFFGKDNYDYWPGIPYLGADDDLLTWSTGEEDDYITDNRDIIRFSCNEDAMFHPSKGLIAMKASGVEGLTVKNLKVENIQDETPLGSDL